MVGNRSRAGTESNASALSRQSCRPSLAAVALLSCRGSPSPKFPRLPPPAHVSLLDLEPEPRLDLIRHTPHSTPTPAVDLRKLLPSRATWENPLGCQGSQMPPGPGVLNVQFGLGTITRRTGCAFLSSPLLPITPYSLPPHIHASIRRNLGVQRGRMGLEVELAWPLKGD